MADQRGECITGGGAGGKGKVEKMRGFACTTGNLMGAFSTFGES
jgi:hypothetical protein